jgi:hypothetical protein
MRAKRLLVVVLVLALILPFGCAAPLQWKPEAQTKLSDWGDWADKWIGGAIKNAPKIIAAVASITGDSKEIQAAAQAVTAANSALGSYHAIVAVGSGDAATAQAELLSAIDHVKDTVGAIKETAEVLGVNPTQ